MSIEDVLKNIWHDFFRNLASEINMEMSMFEEENWKHHRYEDHQAARSQSYIENRLAALSHLSCVILASTTSSILLALPCSLIIIIIIWRNQHLWTYCNLVLLINASSCLIGSIFFNVTKIFIFYPWVSNLISDDTAYMISWWTASCMMRISNAR